MRRQQRATLRSGQSAVEAVALILAAVLGLVALFSVIKSAVSARAKGGADAFGHGLLYDGG